MKEIRFPSSDKSLTQLTELTRRTIGARARQGEATAGRSAAERTNPSALAPSTVDEAALPFDKRRNGMILGAGAVGLVLETDEAAAERRRRPLATVLGAVAANSAFHASAIGTKHASELLHKLLAQVEEVHGLNRHDLASKLLYVSHETFTCARNGGCAGAEVTALKAAFGDDVRRILITNTKGMTCLLYTSPSPRDS